jgi:hypothetical protein
VSQTFPALRVTKQTAKRSSKMALAFRRGLYIHLPEIFAHSMALIAPILIFSSANFLHVSQDR